LFEEEEEELVAGAARPATPLRLKLNRTVLDLPI